jgi:hypothetical protein
VDGSGFAFILSAGSGSRSAKVTHKNEEISSFEELDVLFLGIL